MSVCMTDKLKYLYVDIPWYPIPCKDYALVGNIVIELVHLGIRKLGSKG